MIRYSEEYLTDVIESLGDPKLARRSRTTRAALEAIYDLRKEVELLRSDCRRLALVVGMVALTTPPEVRDIAMRYAKDDE